MKINKMKHIERRFLNQVPIPKNENGEPLHELKRKEPGTLINENVKVPEGFVPLFISDNAAYTGFQVKIDGKKRFIPEPDSLLVYYSTAYYNYRGIADKRKQVIERTKLIVGGEPAIDELYEYFGLVSCVVIFLFMTVEGAMNRCIPDAYVHKKETDKKTELYTKAQIERNFSFEEKIKVLKAITKKEFHISFPLKYQHIINLKQFRDDIIHTKSENQGDTASNHNFRKAFSFNFTEAMLAVRDFCNFYMNKDFIIDCPCTSEW